MTNRNGAKGTEHETKIVRLFKRMFWPDADRLVKTGRLDRGDLRGPRGWTIEAKNLGAINLPKMIAEARTEAGNDGRRWFAGIQKARRGVNSSGRIEDAYFVVPLEMGALLMRAVEILEGMRGIAAGDIGEWLAKVDETLGPVDG